MLCLMRVPFRPAARARRALAIYTLLGTMAIGLAPAHSQPIQRQIPDNAKRATIAYVGNMVVALDGKQTQLSASGQIRNQNNLIIVPSALPTEGAIAEYILDANGQLSRVWLLTPQEAVRKKSTPSKP
jgi:hypothetical protein